MSNVTKIVALLITLTLILAATTAPTYEITASTPVWEVMTRLGKVNVNQLDPDKKGIARKGQELVMQGFTSNLKGKKTARTSPKMPCMACHTLQDEYDNPFVIDPQKRLEYADSLDIPFLPGTPFKGIVNRVFFFNDDYQTIFSHEDRLLVKTGHNNIRKAIQGCNTLYAKGRKLEYWEIESILAFFWTMELKVGELQMPEEDIDIVKQAIETNKDNSKAVNVMRRYYREVYPATLITPIAIEKRKKISPILNSFSNGKRLYRRACLHCHANKRYSNYKLDSKQKTFQFLKKNFDKEKSYYSIYTAMRYAPGHKSEKCNAPHFTAERMSDQQLQDLRFFITQMARLGDEAYDYYKNF